MQNVYESTNALDKRLCGKFGLTQQILVENAANALLLLIRQKTHTNSVVTILCGSGDNGADGYALARKLSGTYKVRIYQAKEPKSPLCIEMCEKAHLVESIKFVSKLLPCDVVVDCLFGSGFKGKMEEELNDIIKQSNNIAHLNIACDIPSGLLANDSVIFKAHHTMCMGALKMVLFSDKAKDFVGEIHTAELGVSRENYELTSNLKLLEKSDMRLPKRLSQNAHKGTFGHLCVFVGSKSGAGILSACAGFTFGTGLVSVIDKGMLDNSHLPLEIIRTDTIPQNVSAFALGMGLGESSTEVLAEIKQRNEPCVIDADALCCEEIYDVLEHKKLLDSQIVLTPHPKEFVALLEGCGFKNVRLDSKVPLVLEFSARYPNVTLLLKGANSIIARNQKIFLNTFGSVALAKGGSGDVLSGMIGALLAQGYDGLNAAITASIAHALAGDLESCSYALTPQKIIANLAKLDTI